MWLYKTEGKHAGVLMVSVRILLLKILASLPPNKEKCSQWLEVLQITENQLKPIGEFVPDISPIVIQASFLQ